MTFAIGFQVFKLEALWE